ncbi:MAG: hypothetical protein AAF297_01690 [Planctomycetota bacterium]
MKTGLMLCATAVLASGANAGIELEFLAQGAGTQVSVDFFGDSRDTFVGQLIHEVDGFTGGLSGLNGQQISFCPDLPEDVATEPTHYELVDLTDVPVTADMSSTPLTSAQADAVLRIVSAAPEVFDASFTGNGRSAAFQLVLWEIIYDFDGTAASLDLESGNVSFTRTDGTSVFSGALGSSATDLLDAAINGDINQGVIALANAGNQDQLFLPTPGGTVVLAAAGLAVARRRRG